MAGDPASANKIPRDKARQLLQRVAHPRWSPSDDHDLMTMKAAGRNFHDIANWLGRPRLAVEGRFHALRMVPRVVELLEASGLSDAPYPAA